MLSWWLEGGQGLLPTPCAGLTTWVRPFLACERFYRFCWHSSVSAADKMENKPLIARCILFFLFYSIFIPVWEMQRSLRWFSERKIIEETTRVAQLMIISKRIWLEQGNKPDKQINVIFAKRGLLRLFIGCTCTIANCYGFVYFQSLKGPLCNPISLPLVYFA